MQEQLGFSFTENSCDPVPSVLVTQQIRVLLGFSCFCFLLMSALILIFQHDTISEVQ